MPEAFASRLNRNRKGSIGSSRRSAGAGRWLHEDGLVPPNSTVDPISHQGPDWAFARHWYSTWVDYRTRKDENGKPMILFSGEDYGVARSRSLISTARARSLPDVSRARSKHHSCWGEWYLAIQRGSENVKLGVDLINNLMSSRKVSERALTGAGLPVLEQFYKINGHAICFETDKSYHQIPGNVLQGCKVAFSDRGVRTIARVLSGRSVPSCRIPTPSWTCVDSSRAQSRLANPAAPMGM